MGESKAGRGNRAKGERGEALAADYLESKGYEILARNYRNRMGEIDLIARSPDGFLVFAEVKYRASASYGDPAEAVDLWKQRRIIRAASGYLAAEQRERLARGMDPGALYCRFDVLAICGALWGNDLETKETDPVRIRHIENAFGAS